MTPSAASPQPVRFFHQGRVVDVTGVHPTRSVLDWLREDARCTGTKEGCNEGDCGACTVVIGELAPAADAVDGRPATDVVGGLRLQTVNACIQFLPTLHGKALFTVEDLKTLAGRTDGPARGDSPHEKHPVRRLHPVQQAMVECHGSQCGFCTPGFVMSLWSTYERHCDAGTRPTRQELADDLSGNLCRCTGYRPILDAGQRMFDLPAAPLDTRAAVAALTRLKSETAEAAAMADGAAGFRYVGARHGRTDTFHAPTTLDELAMLRERLPAAQLLAGSTDVGLWVNKKFRDLGDIVFVGGVEEMKRIGERGMGEGAELYIGAGASLEDAWRALVRRAPSLADVWLRFASPPIRHAGTLGGNVANGSPIGDSPPVLMALDAEVELRRGARVRRLRLDAFYLGYMQNRLESGEFVQGIAVPLAALRRHVRAYKISKRFDSDISALCAGFAIEFEAPVDAGAGASGDPVVKAVRLAFGGMAATVNRAARAEAAVVGRPWTPATVAAAQAALGEDFEPLSDLRASAAYRLKVARNLLQRLWLETRATDPLPNAAVSVWDAMPHVLPAPVAATASAVPFRSQP
ncbi:MAG TPA: xanthine dehydrogenase small subunit [Variovorax sp.]|nr:xanthine dehydrogenase small subunit [Variovorax sp.]